VGGVDALLAAGELAPILDWLRSHVHRRGRLLAPRALVAEACGREPDAATLLGELEAKYGALYGLAPISSG
jgi:carboxypeptidase Taq